jgi:glycine/D-amino acid oxidase-like deaminating enzyme
MQQTVAVFGGGVAGLSAAHELAERGFQVHVYERKPVQHMFVCGEGESSGSF